MKNDEINRRWHIILKQCFHYEKITVLQNHIQVNNASIEVAGLGGASQTQEESTQHEEPEGTEKHKTPL